MKFIVLLKFYIHNCLSENENYFITQRDRFRKSLQHCPGHPQHTDIAYY